MAGHKIRIPADPRNLVRVCEKGKHGVPLSSGNGAAYDWDATAAEFNFWHSLDLPGRSELLRQANEGCFLCALDKLMATQTADADSPTWVATEEPRHYRKMVGSKSGIRMCTLCYEEQKRIIYGEYEVTLVKPGGKILVCQAHKTRLEAEGNILEGK